MRRPDPLLAAAVANLIRGHDLKWDIINGVGFMSARFAGDGTFAMYVHVWDPSLRAADMEDSGMWHDHRFSFRSVVLLGAIHDTEVVSLVASPPGNDTYELHAVDSDLSTQRVDGDLKIVTSPHVYEAGATYQYPANKFHRVEVQELTVTCCTMVGDLGGGGRLLARRGMDPVHVADGWGSELFRPSHCDSLRRRAANLLLGGVLPP